MVDRIMAILMLWSMRGAVAWVIAHEYATAVNAKLTQVTRALSGF